MRAHKKFLYLSQLQKFALTTATISSVALTSLSADAQQSTPLMDPSQSRSFYDGDPSLGYGNGAEYILKVRSVGNIQGCSPGGAFPSRFTDCQGSMRRQAQLLITGFDELTNSEQSIVIGSGYMDTNGQNIGWNVMHPCERFAMLGLTNPGKFRLRVTKNGGNTGLLRWGSSKGFDVLWHNDAGSNLTCSVFRARQE